MAKKSSSVKLNVRNPFKGFEPLKGSVEPFLNGETEQAEFTWSSITAK
jgi:hypothetical protein